MKQKTTLIKVLHALLIVFSIPLSAFAATGSDTCTVNDICQTAIPIQVVVADQPFVCIEGCNIGATPEVYNNQCMIGAFPTVWYEVITGDNATLMNIQVNSNDIESPAITLFQSLSDCNDLVQIPLTHANLPCVVGSNGVTEALGTDVGANSRYYIAVTSQNNDGGSFSLCVNTISLSSLCVSDRDIEIIARSFGGDLSGPFQPGETLSICMNVNSYTAVGNGCQWFQGLVPVFGNGWDPASFDQNSQPLNTTLNGTPIGEMGNGLYGASTWDWFTDVDYHYSNETHQVGDFDGNGTLDMCNTLYDPDCPNLGGLDGACCGPCWGAPLGTILPPGWFAYGNNGSCSTPGPPIRVDWGDGNTCGGGMGPWSFCFDLVVRSFPDCTEDNTTSDLSIGYFTFADGETGSWTGSASVCVLDQPVKITLPFQCGIETDLGVEQAGDICADNVFNYIISEPDIDHWTWSIFPSWAVKHSAREGDSGFVINDTLINSFINPVEVTYFFTGFDEHSDSTVVKQVRFRVIPGIKTPLPNVIYTCERDKDTLTISADPVSGGLAPYQFLWQPGGNTTSTISIIPPFQPATVSLDISDSIGCKYHKDIVIKVHPCHLDTIKSDDESNEDHTFDDPPIRGGKVIFNEPGFIPTNLNEPIALKIYPQPATDLVYIDWTHIADDAMELFIFDINGAKVFQSAVPVSDRKRHRLQVSTDHYSGGVYFVMIKTNHSMLTGKLIVMSH